MVGVRPFWGERSASPRAGECKPASQLREARQCSWFICDRDRRKRRMQADETQKQNSEQRPCMVTRPASEYQQALPQGG